MADRFVRFVYRYAGGPHDFPELDAVKARARRVRAYPPAGGGEAWVLEPSDGESLRRTASELQNAEPEVPIFFEDESGDAMALEKAGFRRRAARLSLLGHAKYFMPPRGAFPSAGDLAKRALAGVVPAGGLVVRGDPRAGAVHLTFDDGPHPEHTPRVLDALAAVGATATFFVVGRDAEQHPAIVRRIVDEGHTLGHHSFTHGSPSRTSARVLLDEVKRTLEVLRDIVGFAPRLFRPPRGQLTSGKLVRLWAARQKIILWNVDPRDFACASPADLQAALDGGQLQAGDIVLLHDDTPLLPPILADFARGLAGRGVGLRALEPSVLGV